MKAEWTNKDNLSIETTGRNRMSMSEETSRILWSPLYNAIESERRNTMIENKYKVYVNGHLTANNMPLEDAMIYVKAIFETYYNDNSIKVQIMPEERTNSVE